MSLKSLMCLCASKLSVWLLQPHNFQQDSIIRKQKYFTHQYFLSSSQNTSLGYTTRGCLKTVSIIMFELPKLRRHLNSYIISSFIWLLEQSNLLAINTFTQYVQRSTSIHNGQEHFLFGLAGASKNGWLQHKLPPFSVILLEMYCTLV